MVGSALAFKYILGSWILLYLSQVKMHIIPTWVKPELIYDTVYLRFQMGFWWNVWKVIKYSAGPPFLNMGLYFCIEVGTNPIHFYLVMYSFT